MNIGIDFHSAEREGTGNCTYIRNLVEKLVSLDSSNEYFLYITNLKYPYHETFKKYKNVRFRQTKSTNPFIRLPLLGIETFKDKIDVLHMQYIAPPFYKGKLVVIIHDLAFLHFPECFSFFEHTRSSILVPYNARNSCYVLTVSNFSKNDISQKLNIPLEKIEVTYDACRESFMPVSDTQKIKKTLDCYGIKGKFVLSVGRLDPRKNLLRLIEAFKSLKNEHKIPHKLVIAGKKDYLSGNIENAVKGLENDIIMTGYIPDETLPILYSAADVFVYPTLFEGFGLPCLEAMSCGCPVISSNTSSIPEVVGDSGLLINPYDTREIANAIYKVLMDNELRNIMKQKGLNRAKDFSWEKSAFKTLEVYKKVKKYSDSNET